MALWLHIPSYMLTFATLFLGTLGSVEEGKVANFLLATTGFVKLRYSIMKKKKLLEVGILPEILVIHFFSNLQCCGYDIIICT